MLKNIKKIVPSRRFALPLLGLFLAVGAVAQRAQPVLSKQIARLQPVSSSHLDEVANINPELISKKARLRKVLDSSSVKSLSDTTSLSPGETYTWIQRNTFNYENLRQELDTNSSNQTINTDKASVRGLIPANNFPTGDGVFLYGSSQRAGEIGKGYIVFEKQANKVVGGMYMPASEFNCFQGDLNRTGEIAMTVKGYAGDINPTQVASTDRLPKEDENQLANYAYSVTLQDYYQLDAVSKEDRNILQTCKANFQ
ncbi:MAG: hypothetical protein AAF630_14645 [Cyanobacteria bacterium P01_C01_bin.38]